MTKKPVLLLACSGLLVAGSAAASVELKGAPPPRRLTAATIAPATGVSPKPARTDGSAAGNAGGATALCPAVAAPTSPAAPTATHLFTRTTADAVTIRVYRVTGGPVPGCGPGPVEQYAIAPACSYNGVSIEMSDVSAVGQGGLGWGPVSDPTANPSLPVHTVSSPASGSFGVIEADPVWWVALQVDHDVGTVQATFADGSQDSMAPADGVVVLAHHVAASAAADPYEVTASLRLLDSGGVVLGAFAVPAPVPVPVPVPMPVPLPSASPSTPGRPQPGNPPDGSTSSGSVGGAAATAPAPGAPTPGVGGGSAIACPMVPAPVRASGS